MTSAQASLITASGVFAGMINSVAGGGSFLTLPVLVSCGLPSIAANATSTIALWPGTLASFGAYRREMAAQKSLAVALGLVSLVGGAIGAWILLHTPQLTFDRLLPWLTLFATVLFGFGPRVAAGLKLSLGEGDDHKSLLGTGTLQFVVAVYGGYYGAGAGIMMLAILALLGMKNIHAMNAFKTLLNAAFNATAILVFILQGIVHWPEALWMMAGGIMGGYGGAWLARRTPPALIRALVIFTGVVTTGYFFWRAR